MLVMQRPMKTSSTLSPATAESRRRRQGRWGTDDRLFDFGQVDLDHRGVFGIASAFIRLGVGQPLFHLAAAALQGAWIAVAVGNH